MPYILGLTGGIATGKSTVADMFRNVSIPVIDADRIAHEVMAKGTPTFEAIVSEFGEDLLMQTGHFNRQRLAELVFKDKKRRERLNKIVHPVVLEKIKMTIQNMQESHPIIVLDVPLLYEANIESMCDAVVVVYTDEDIQIDRLRTRDGLSEPSAKLRARSQLPLEEKIAKADYVIDNSHSVLDTRKQFNTMLIRITEEAKEHGHIRDERTA